MALSNTHFGYEKIESIMGDTPKHIYFAGIGGISVNSLARVCHVRGHKVCGYDRTKTRITEALEELGVTVYYESDAQNIKDCDVLVYTVAIPEDDPAYVYAGEHGIPRISRADFLGYIMMGYDSRIGVSGMHGKSTTTAIVASVYEAAGLKPTVFGGAEIKRYGASNVLGSEDAFIFEACEYMDSFLDFYPTTALVLNIEMDHVDYFHSMEQIRESFTKFMSRARCAVVNKDDVDVMTASKSALASIVTFGSAASGADYTVDNIVFGKGEANFDIYCKGKLLCHGEMNIPGEHIVTDALAAAAVAHTDGISGEAIARGLRTYTGIARRMDLRGKTEQGAAVYDDYAHHPTEIATTLKTVAKMGFNHTYCVFQSHTYSRTAELFEDFAKSLAESELDEVILCPIYAAREVNTYGVTAEALADRVRELGKRCTAVPDFEAAVRILNSLAHEDDAVFVIGAGDVIKVSDLLLAE